MNQELFNKISELTDHNCLDTEMIDIIDICNKISKLENEQIIQEMKKRIEYTIDLIESDHCEIILSGNDGFDGQETLGFEDSKKYMINILNNG